MDVFRCQRTDAQRNSQSLPPRAVGSDITDAACPGKELVCNLAAFDLRNAVVETSG
jgi:hypothetical protein